MVGVPKICFGIVLWRFDVQVVPARGATGPAGDGWIGPADTGRTTSFLLGSWLAVVFLKRRLLVGSFSHHVLK